MRPTSGLVGRASKNSLNGCFYAAMSAQSNIFQKRGLSERVKNICDCRGAEGDNPEGEAVVNDDLNGRQSRRTDRSIFTAVKMQDHVVQILLACRIGHRTALKCHRHNGLNYYKLYVFDVRRVLFPVLSLYHVHTRSMMFIYPPVMLATNLLISATVVFAYKPALRFCTTLKTKRNQHIKKPASCGLF